MFEYTFSCGGFKTHTNMTDTGISFDPPVYEQRYCAAVQILEDPRWVDEIKKVTEFGCAEMRLCQFIRRIETIENILQVDIDEETLKKHMVRTNPLIIDHIKKRQCPLHIEVLHGSVADSADQLKGTDAVIALELIEHVYDDVLSKIPCNVFGFMQPKIAVFSTPNSDFNVLFTRFKPLFPNGFRHLDHKFEWTREEFKTWCMDIAEKYPNYMFALLGVGEPPTGNESVGYVSQIALFVRKDLLGMPLVESLKADSALECATLYRSVHSVDYPFYVDNRTQEEKIWTEIEIELQLCTHDEDNYDADIYAYKISVEELLKRLQHMEATREILDKLLKQYKKRIENDFVIIEDEDELESNYSHKSSDLHEEEAHPINESEDWDT